MQWEGIRKEPGESGRAIPVEGWSLKEWLCPQAGASPERPGGRGVDPIGEGRILWALRDEGSAEGAKRGELHDRDGGLRWWLLDSTVGHPGMAESNTFCNSATSKNNRLVTGVGGVCGGLAEATPDAWRNLPHRYGRHLPVPTSRFLVFEYEV